MPEIATAVSYKKPSRDPRKKQRCSVGLQLVYGEDDDLIAWYRTMQSDNISVNAWLKQMIRERLAEGSAAPPDPVLEPNPMQVVLPVVQAHDTKLEWLNAELEGVKAVLQQRRGAAPVNNESPTQTVISPQAASWMHAQEEQLAHLVRQFQRVEAELQSLRKAETPSPSNEEPQAIDEARARKRRSRMAKNTW